MLLHTGVGLGLTRDDLMAAAQLTEDDLADRDVYVPFRKQIALGSAIVQGRPNVNVGLAALQHVSPASFGMLGYAISNAETLRASLAMFIRFQRIMTDGLRWTLAGDSGTTLLLETDQDYAQLGFPVEAILGIWLRLGRMLTGTMWTPHAVRFRHAPLGAPSEVESYFGTRVQFRAAENALVLDKATLALPLVVGNVALQPSLSRLVQARLAEIEGHASFTDELREVMFEQIPRGETTREALARRLGTSPRTMNRRLREESTTFRDVLDDVRRDLAELWLREPKHSIYDVAFLLGYSDPSTFHRSFRRWTGHSPHVWRKRQALSP